MEALILATALLFFVILLRMPLQGLKFLILITPLSATAVMNQRLSGIPGLKLPNVLALAVLCIFMVLRRPYPLKKLYRIFFTGMLVLFITAVLRSISYMPHVYDELWSDGYSLGKYILSYLIKPLLLLIPMALTAVYVRRPGELRMVIDGLIASIFLLSCTILMIYLFRVPDKTQFELVRHNIGDILGMHGNNLADFYIISFPMLLAYSLNTKKLFPAITCSLSLASIGILYSRSAYFAVLLGIFLLLIMSERARMIYKFLIALTVSAIMIPSGIKQRALTGFADNSIEEISAGRFDNIWMPLLKELMRYPSKMLFGVGRYGIMGTEAFADDLTLKVSHAHNMYLDMVLDSGIIGLGFFITMLLTILRDAVRLRSKITDLFYRDILCGVSVSIISFLFRGITDSFIYPSLTNSYLWIILGIGMSVCSSPELHEGGLS